MDFKTITLETWKSLRRIFYSDNNYLDKYTKQLLAEVQGKYREIPEEITTEQFFKTMLRYGRAQELSKPYYYNIRGENWLRIDVIDTGGFFLLIDGSIFYAFDEEEFLRITYSRKLENDRELVSLNRYHDVSEDN